MTSEKPIVRAANSFDSSAITEIYAHHVLNGKASFELTPPDEPEIRARMAKVSLEGLPWIVAEANGIIVGYAYMSAYRARPAYASTVEDSVYIRSGHEGKGYGRTLLREAISLTAGAGKRQIIAVIGDSANTGSINLHRSLGFEDAGVLKNVGYKHGQWLDTVFMQLTIGEGAKVPPAALTATVSS